MFVFLQYYPRDPLLNIILHQWTKYLGKNVAITLLLQAKVNISQTLMKVGHGL